MEPDIYNTACVIRNSPKKLDKSEKKTLILRKLRTSSKKKLKRKYAETTYFHFLI